ncbi:restriction endonuclease subunit S [Psychrobacter pygoscelis]|uniref:restriction endonuclease subunit S n=1 Tax=Psychrobacter pygoscelis TaxID=2488563 RepID=UPI00103EC559|nr:restriction endonuclease subunit S [Psychrobacter pygoscelis]
MVPKGWKATEIDNLATFLSGGTPSKQNQSYWNGTEPWISGKDLKSHYLYSSIDKLTKEGFTIAKKVPKGTVLILVRGMTLLKDFPVGYTTREVSFNQDLKALIPSKNVDGLYLSFLLVGERHKIMNLVSTAGHGTGRLDTNLLKHHPVNLPPLPEQQKIAKILATWDKAISTTERLIDNSQQQKKALMQQLLTGKQRLLDDSGVRFSGEWEKVKLGDVAAMNSGGTPKSTVKAYYGGDIPWVSISDMTKYGKWISITERYLTEEGLLSSSARLYPKGTILYAMYASIGECSIADIPVSSSQAILGIRPSEKLNNLYLYYYLSNLKKRIAQMGQQGTQANLNAGMVKEFRLNLPSLEEQQKIATVLTNADREIELLQQQLADLQQEKRALMQQLLTGKRRVLVDGEVA